VTGPDRSSALESFAFSVVPSPFSADPCSGPAETVAVAAKAGNAIARRTDAADAVGFTFQKRTAAAMPMQVGLEDLAVLQEGTFGAR
jgi:hypothetical protein